MTEGPINRHEHVRVAPHHEEHVVHDASGEQRQILTRVTQLIWLVAAILEVLILVRVFLKLIAANPASPFATLVYGLSDIFLFPFFGLTATPAIGNGMVLEIPSIIAMLVYFFGFWILVKLVWLLFEQPSVRPVTIVDAEPESMVEERVIVEQEPMFEEQVVLTERPVVEETVTVEEEPELGRRVVRKTTHKRRY